ncbi:triphosphoribosyl-dephospho-CoA synthase [Roseixanthobacter glucoisosaccharinicivorans]|uniref:triphosphoribosyl-dephospho-CoA synthase n=1 Tax=Roseixanthobacter glucoisosaccharinicivorans TaxID=3119923 RepID=UPI0037268F24
MTPERAADLFERACRAELQALKPGNVHVHAAGHDMDVAQFERAAAAAAPALTTPGPSIGARIEAAVSASLAAAGCNTNLGIVLLCAPLVHAALSPGPGDLRARLKAALEALTIEDAASTFRAIAAAKPGGLGTARADVRFPAAVDLKAAMAEAAPRDRIAFQYVHDFTDVFEIGGARLHGGADPFAPEVVQAVYLDFLTAFPDSHIARKFGADTAEAVLEEARETVRLRTTFKEWESRHISLLAFDSSLKKRGLNPGTSADLTVASVLAHALERDALERDDLG